MKYNHDSDDSICTDTEGGSTNGSEILPSPSHIQVGFRKTHESGEWWELCSVTGEGVEEADDSVLAPLQEEEAVDGVEDAVVPEQREQDADDGARGEVEEADVAAHLAVARVEAVALGQHHPPARVEARVDDAAAAWGERARPPVRADGAEADVVPQVAREHPPPDQADQICRERRPARR